MTPPLSWDDADHQLGFPPRSIVSSSASMLATKSLSTSATSSFSNHSLSDGDAGEQPPRTATSGSRSQPKPVQLLYPLSLHGSTKTGSQRRLGALKRILRAGMIQQGGLEGTVLCQAPADAHDDDDDTTHKTESTKAVTTTTTTVIPVLVSPPDLERKKPLGKVWNHDFIDGDRVDRDDNDDDDDDDRDHGMTLHNDEDKAHMALNRMFNFHPATTTTTAGAAASHADGASAAAAAVTDIVPNRILPGQASYAGTFPAQESKSSNLSVESLRQIPVALLDAFHLGGLGPHDDGCPQKRSLFTHQVQAIDAALLGQHCSVCTSTGSGKSLCFLIPVLTAAYNHNSTSLILFPTKALAQDQFTKLQGILQRHSSGSNNDDDGDRDRDDSLFQRIRPATLDGDSPHSLRPGIAQTANVILTNPDTLHAAILPNWASTYRPLLARLRYVVIDEAHMYDGVFGAHVAMILSRLMRIRHVAAATMMDHPTTNAGTTTAPLDAKDHDLANGVVFLTASATMPWPEQHFRLLCPIGPGTPVTILSMEEDGSPRPDKHFFVWNPPILNIHGQSTGHVSFVQLRRGEHDQITKSSSTARSNRASRKRSYREHVAPSHSQASSRPAVKLLPTLGRVEQNDDVGDNDEGIIDPLLSTHQHRPESELHRRHAADETALLLTRAIMNGVRCIAFCRTRNLVEWVYERTIAALKADPITAPLTSRVESYRGGYEVSERRKIEGKLFRNELLGVVGTNALELGVDIGGIDLALHCGYPSSYASLLQQAGRAGRGGQASLPLAASLSIVVCFSAPSEQHIWRHPSCLLARGPRSASNTIPVSADLVQSHLLCACEEFPSTGSAPVSSIVQDPDGRLAECVLSDHDLFGGQDVYEEALDVLKAIGSLVEEEVPASEVLHGFNMVYKAHPSMKRSWSRVSIRSIEPVNYALVDLSHPAQNNRMDGIHSDQAVIDTVPYSRVFYHAHPGAIITHRGRRYKVVSMMRPPAFHPQNYSYRRSLKLAAFVKPTNRPYATIAMRTTRITLVKQLERVELRTEKSAMSSSTTDETQQSAGGCDLALSTFAGFGLVSIKRSVYGYKKISLVTRKELSRSELSLPELEYDTAGMWLDADATTLTKVLGPRYGRGVHALSHALLAVAPLFAPGVSRSDLDCDHSYDSPTHVMLFDERAGGSGACNRFWGIFSMPDGPLQAAVKLLEECSSCEADLGYDGGCPECLHASKCINFNTHMSRSAGLLIGQRMLQRLKETDAYQSRIARENNNDGQADNKGGNDDGTPRRKARLRAMRLAKEMPEQRRRQYVCGRPSWPLDGDDARGKAVHG